MLAPLTLDLYCPSLTGEGATLRQDAASARNEREGFLMREGFLTRGAVSAWNEREGF